MALSDRFTRWLWFDVEKRYKTIRHRHRGHQAGLWFDVEKRYKTIVQSRDFDTMGCGLM